MTLIKKIIRKVQVGDHVRISKYKNVLEKGYVPNLYENVFVIKNVKKPVSWTYIISDLNSEEIVWTFYKKELLKTNQKEFRVENMKNLKKLKIWSW